MKIEKSVVVYKNKQWKIEKSVVVYKNKQWKIEKILLYKDCEYDRLYFKFSKPNTKLFLFDYKEYYIEYNELCIATGTNRLNSINMLYNIDTIVKDAFERIKQPNINVSLDVLTIFSKLLNLTDLEFASILDEKANNLEKTLKQMFSDVKKCNITIII